LKLSWQLRETKGMEIVLVISYMDGDGVQHFRLDQVREGAVSF